MLTDSQGRDSKSSTLEMLHYYLLLHPYFPIPPKCKDCCFLIKEMIYVFIYLFSAAWHHSCSAPAATAGGSSLGRGRAQGDARSILTQLRSSRRPRGMPSSWLQGRVCPRKPLPAQQPCPTAIMPSAPKVSWAFFSKRQMLM